MEQLMSVKSSPSITIVIKHGKMYVRGSMSERRHPMAVLWMEYIYWMLQEVCPLPKPQPAAKSLSVNSSLDVKARAKM